MDSCWRREGEGGLTHPAPFGTWSPVFKERTIHVGWWLFVGCGSVRACLTALYVHVVCRVRHVSAVQICLQRCLRLLLLLIDEEVPEPKRPKMMASAVSELGLRVYRRHGPKLRNLPCLQGLPG